MDATKSTVAEVMVLVASRVRWKVIVTVPEPPASAPTIAGTSLAGSIVAVNTGVLFGPVVVGVVEVLLLPQPAAQRPRTTARTGIRYIGSAPLSAWADACVRLKADTTCLGKTQKNLRVRLKPRCKFRGA